MATTTDTRYYVISRQYVGPRRTPAPRDTVEVTTEPPRTNMSREVRLSGWLGTTNEWAAYAHGEHETQEAAEAAARSLGATYEIEDQDEGAMALAGTVLVLGLGDHDPREEWDAADWIAESSWADLGLSAAATDEEIDARARELEEEAAADGQWITGGAEEIARVIRARRDADRE